MVPRFDCPEPANTHAHCVTCSLDASEDRSPKALPEEAHCPGPSVLLCPDSPEIGVKLRLNRNVLFLHAELE